MKHWPLRALLALVILAMPVLPAAAQQLPALTGRVVDGAGLLDAATEARITEKLAAFEKTSSDQVVVVTVPDLQGYAVEEFGVALGRAWKIGREGEDNGVLLLVSKGDRKVRIEVGYGLEGTLTDALSSVIVQTDILPAFRADDYPGGIEKGADAILQVLSGNAAEVAARAERNSGWEDGDASALVFAALFGLVWLVVIGGFVMLSLAKRFGTKVGKNRWRWLGMLWTAGSGVGTGGGFSGGGFSGGSSSGGSSGGGFSGGGGSFGGGGSSGSW